MKKCTVENNKNIKKRFSRERVYFLRGVFIKWIQSSEQSFETAKTKSAKDIRVILRTQMNNNLYYLHKRCDSIAEGKRLNMQYPIPTTGRSEN